jgi:hypothetical protein
MARSKADKLAEIHSEALEEFDRIQSVVMDERTQALEDRRFYSVAGAQWEGPLGDQFENKPRFEFNKVHLAVIRIINEYRNNRITVDFTPKDGAQDNELSEVCDGLYRADEQDSGAQEAYDNAFEEAVGGGFGAWRLRSCYEDEEDDENEKQRIRIEPIFDADTSVFFDLDAKRQDKADATRCFVLTSMSYQAFEEQFGHSPATWEKGITGTQFDWCTPDVVYVAEYYRVEEKSEVVYIFQGLDGEDMRVPAHEFDEEPGKRAELEAMGFQEVRQKRIKRRQVHKYLLSGDGVEEDCGYIAGRNIPIVPVYGKRWYVDNVERCMGHVRLAKDAQRLTNSLLSWLTEIAGRFDTEKPIFSPQQIQGHATMWAEDNVKRYPYLLANMVKDTNGQFIPGSQAPVAYTKAPNVPPAMAALIQVASQSLSDLLGNQQAGEEMQSNISGKVVELIQQRLDMQTFIYVSNMAKAVKRSGEIWLSMAKEVMPEKERPMKTVSSDGQAATVMLRRPMIDEDGEEYLQHDLTEASFDVWVDVGPSSSSRRSSTVRALTGMAQITQDPDDRKVLIAASLMNMEGEGLADLRDYYRKKLVRIGAVKPTEEEQAEMAQEQANTPPDPQAQFLLASAEDAKASASLKRAGAVEKVASADLKRAQTAESLAKADGEANSQRIATVQALQQVLNPGQPRL